MRKPIGYFIETTSVIDGSPIVLIITLKSRNDKTGNMIQTWIMRSDLDPLSAVVQGLDRAICGDCCHRPSLCHEMSAAPCYVTVFHAPLNIYRAYRRGRYVRWDKSLASLRALVGRELRIGSYGDPCAVREALWTEVLEALRPRRWSGYTHLWRETYAQWARKWVMASVNSRWERTMAKLAGWRTFRVSRHEDERLPGRREFHCPASDAGGNRLKCIDCTACDGTHGRFVAVIDVEPMGDVTIYSH